MKKLKKIIGGIFIVAILFTAGLIYVNGLTSQGGYDIKHYDVTIDVTDGNILRVTETIDAFFYEQRHGIFRTIPTSGTINRLNAKDTTYRAMVYGIEVSEKYSKSSTYGEGGAITLKIGDANAYVKGAHQYVISYNYYLGEDNIKDFDEIYYNIIGTDWDCDIKEVTFKITMPKEFDTSKLGFSHGELGSVNSDGIDYNIDGTVITGSIKNLNPNEALTVRCELPQGYFKVIDFINIIDYVVIAFVIFLVLISLVNWFKYGKDRMIIQTVEFYPPEDLNSLELAFAYKGKAEEKDVTSLLIYLANKGYIRIEENKEKKLFGDKFKIIKIKEYDGDNLEEQAFFNGLFRTKDVVGPSDLKDRFYKTQDKILKSTNSKTNKNKIIDKLSVHKRKITTLSIFIVVLLAALVGVINYEVPEIALFALPFTLGIIFPIVYAITDFKSFGLANIFVIPIYILFSCAFGFAVISIVGEYNFHLNLVDWITLGTCAVGFVVLLFLRAIMYARTEYGSKILGKIKGFKNFLVNARKDELEQLVNENPTYFYDILPYTYVLGISEKWIKKFEEINITSPSWYDSTSDFNVISFGNSMNKTFASTSNAMSSSPSESGGGSGGSSGGSSGGGSSGGGSGGGGGGSW